MLVADNAWTGAVAGIAGVVGIVIGYVAEAVRGVLSSRKQRKQRDQELREAARVVAAAFENAAEGLQTATASNGSLAEWGNDATELERSLDQIRKDASGEVWTEVERASRVLRDLRKEQSHGRALTGAWLDVAQRFEDTAAQVEAAYDAG
jgi:type II secretory pathway pseudopilin PulG